MTYTYTTDSIQADDRDIYRMRIFAREITYGSMNKRCDLIHFAKAYGLKSGEELAKYPKVKFCKSAFCGRRCYYVAIDGVKYIWCEQEDHNGESQTKNKQKGTRGKV